MIRRVVIPAAGLGTRLFPATKEQPKEMLPVFSETQDGQLVVKPVVQVVFEQLYNVGFREFCYVTGKGKRSIEDHFTVDKSLIETLEHTGKISLASDLERFYEKLRNSTIMWVNQPSPRGFGDAVLMARPFVEKEPFLVHAGDSILVSRAVNYIGRLLDIHERYSADATFIVLEIEKPEHYGIIEGNEMEAGVIKVESAVEKPAKPATNLAIMAMYAFRPVIMKALETISHEEKGEIHLTNAIQKLIDWDLGVYAVKLDRTYAHLDVGSPERYWSALELSYKHFCKKSNNAVCNLRYR